MPVWNAEYECMERETLEELQLRRLQTTAAWVYERVPYYRDAMSAAGVRPGDVKRLRDVRLLPMTDKDAMRDAYPFGLFAVPMEQVVRIHSSSGTTGKPTVVGYTRGDMNTWAEITARVASMAGVTSKDKAQIGFGYGMFTAAFGMHQGLERVGATVIPASEGGAERHIMMMQDFGTTVLVSTPSNALFLADEMDRAGVDARSLSLRVGLFGGEPLTDGMAREIESRLGILCADNYGLSEVMGPGLSGECECRCGMHVAEDHFLFEVLDPATHEPVPEGEEGELVITSLTKEALPVVRYRTKDLTTLTKHKCECGRTSMRMTKVRKRIDDMLIVRGVNVYPSQVEDVLAGIEGCKPHYLIVVDRKKALDDMEVRIEVAEEFFSDSMAVMEAFSKRVHDALFGALGLTVKVTLVEPGTIERTVGKAKRVIDMREAG